MKRVALFCTLFSLLVPIVWADTVSLSLNQARVDYVLEMFSKRIGVKIIPAAGIGERTVSAYLENVDAEEALDAILAANGMYRQPVPGTDIFIVFAGQKPAGEAPISEKTSIEAIRVSKVRAAEVAATLGKMGMAGGIAVDVRTNSLLARGTPQEIARLRELVEALDVEYEKSAVTTQVFRLKHAQLPDVWQILPTLLNRGIGGASKATVEIESVPVEITTTGSATSAAPAAAATTTGGGTTVVSVGGGTLAGRVGGIGSPAITGKVKFSDEISEGFTLVPDHRTNSIIGVGTENFLKEVAALLTKIDVPVPQISIEAVLVELTEDAARNLGIEWGTPAGSLGAFTGSVTYEREIPGDGTSSSLAKVTESFGNLTANLKMLESKGKANILANPRVVTLNDSPATIRLTSNIPVAPKVTTTGTAGGTATTTTEYEYRDIGITLVAIPHLSGDGNIIMEVEPKVVTAKKSGFFGDAVETSERSAATKVTVKDGGTLVIGGLLSTEEMRSRSGVPLLGRIFPFLFSSSSRQAKKTDLVIFVSPRIITEEEFRKAEEEKTQMTTGARQ